jgi:hypothetical protein
MWKNQIRKPNFDQIREEKDILAEFSAIDIELVKALVSLRQEPGQALLHRIQSIPYQDFQAPSLLHQATGGEPMRTNRFFPLANLRLATLRSFLVLTAFLVFVLLLAFSIPATRTMAMQTIAEIRQVLGISVLSPDDEFVTFTPDLPFNIKQPSYLPEGFVRTVSNLSFIDPETETTESLTEEMVSNGSDILSSGIVSQRIATYHTDAPHVIFAYEADPDQYILLFERVAQAGETLPDGESRMVGNQPATLLEDDDFLALNWIEDGTWLTLESSLTGDELLRVAASMVTIQTISETNNVVHSFDTSDYPYCDPEKHPPDSLANEVSRQQYRGSLRIHIADSNKPARIPYAGQESPEALLHRALTALQDPDMTMQPLDYSTQAYFQLSEGELCWELIPIAPGYIDFVIEVWDERVTINVGGEGVELKSNAELKAIAINALERELENIR